MATWREQYLAALQARDKVEKANLDLYNYSSKIADEKAALQKKLSAAQAATTTDASADPSVTSPQSTSYFSAGIGLRRVASPAARPDSPTLTLIRQDLSKAQQERSDLQTRLDTAFRELEALKSKSKIDSKRIMQLSTQLSQLTVKLRDRDEELRGKGKLIENVQDENVTLNLQLNMAEEQMEKLKKENQELVDRWMAEKGREAEKMNEDSRFG